MIEVIAFMGVIAICLSIGEVTRELKRIANKMEGKENDKTPSH